MRTARLAALALAAAVAGCGPTTFPWSTSDSGTTTGGGGGGGGSAMLVLSTSSLSFSAVQGGSAPAAKGVTLSIQGTPPPTLYVTVVNGGPPVSSATFQVLSGVAQVIVSVVAPTTIGTTTGTVTVHVYADSARTQELGGSPKTISVTYEVQPAAVPGSFSVSPTSLSFSALQGDPAPASQDLTVTTQAGSSGAVYLSVQVSGISGATAVLDATVTPAVVHVTMPATSSTASGHVYVNAYEDAAHTKTLPGSPKDVPVTYTVTPSQLSATPTSLTFSTPAGATPEPQTVQLTDAIGSASWTSSVTYQSGSGWLSVSPTTGTALPASATVSVTPPSTAATYNATIAFTARGVTRNVGVTLTVMRPRIVATPTSLAFSSIRGQTTPVASRSLALAADNGATLAYTTSVTYGSGASGWLTVPSSGTAPESIDVGIGGGALAAGRYTATLTIAAASGASTNVPITYDVANPALTVWGGSLSFFVNQYTTVAQASQPFILEDGGTPIAWTAMVSAPWLQITPASGVTGTTYPTASLVLPELETMAQGTHTATVVLSYVAASGATVEVRVPVTLSVYLGFVDFVTPRVSVEGVGGDVVVRGRGFQYPWTLRFGTTAATWSYGRSDVEIIATPPALAAGSYAVHVQNNLGLARSRASLEVIPTVTRAEAFVPSAGTKTKAVFDDVRKALYVANVGSGKIQRHREASGWVLATDGSDEIALPGLKNIALSPDGRTLLSIAGTAFRTIDLGTRDAPTFQLSATQPATTLWSSTSYELEFVNDGKAIYVDGPSWGNCGRFDPAVDVATIAGLCKDDTLFAPAKDGAHVAVFGRADLSPDQGVSLFDAVTGYFATTSASQDASCGAEDRHGNRTLLFGWWNATKGRRESRLYDSAFTVLPGTVADTTLAVALSSIGLNRAYTWDGARVHAWNIEGPLDNAGLYGEAWKPAVSPKALPGNGALLVLSADEKTAFLVGNQNVVVVPLP